MGNVDRAFPLFKGNLYYARMLGDVFTGAPLFLLAVALSAAVCCGQADSRVVAQNRSQLERRARKYSMRRELLGAS